MRSIYALDPDELAVWLAARRQPAYRAQQILKGVYGRRVASFEELSSLPMGLRRQLAAEFEVGGLPVARRWEGADSGKLLLRLGDGARVECVAMRTRWGETACVSSQVGCPMACLFCASGARGLERNLAADEIVRQVISLAEAGAKITNIVFMGMGEPLLNYDAVLEAIAAFTSPERMGLSPRHLTVGTAGIVPAIPRLAEEAPRRLELAVSLNAPDDELRRRLMPAAARWSIAELLRACDRWTEARDGQPVTFAYVLMAGVNDSFAQADQLARLLRNRRHFVNLIRMNPVAADGLQPCSRGRARAFADRLAEQGINAALRRSLGGDVRAACGQLRRIDAEAEAEAEPEALEATSAEAAAERRPQARAGSAVKPGARAEGDAARRRSSRKSRRRPRRAGHHPTTPRS